MASRKRSKQFYGVPKVSIPEIGIYRADAEFDTRAPRDVKRNEMLYLYSIKYNTGRNIYYLFSLERNKQFTIQLFDFQNFKSWFTRIA